MRFILGCVILVALITGGCLLWTNYGVPLAAAPTASLHDGLQYVRIYAVDPTAPSITIEHITYFAGEEARLSALRDAPDCKDQIVSCVPSLAKGYYVRESGAPNATFALMDGARYVLLPNRAVTLSQLAAYAKNSTKSPVFTISITSGRITEVKELNHL